MFDGRDKKGGILIDPRGQEDFVFQMAETEFKWDLPLHSLGPPKYCPEDGQALNGVWAYCPWHGQKLTDKK